MAPEEPLFKTRKRTPKKKNTKEPTEPAKRKKGEAKASSDKMDVVAEKAPAKDADIFSKLQELESKQPEDLEVEEPEKTKEKDADNEEEETKEEGEDPVEETDYTENFWEEAEVDDLDFGDDGDGGWIFDVRSYFFRGYYVIQTQFLYIYFHNFPNIERQLR